jgi:two-component system phosphate regulon response regulator PhoB
MFAMVTLSPQTRSPVPELDSRRRVLVVEDEAEIRQLIVLHLRRQGFEIDEAADGLQARTLLETRAYDLAVLDWMLPAISGLELTRWTRQQPGLASLPILFVTAKGEPEHIAAALDGGADDYLTKPFDTVVLMARVNALLRRKDWMGSAPSASGTRRLSLGELVLDPDSFEATIGSEKLELTRSEFRLLECLLQNQGKVCTRESLIGRIQGEGVNVVGRTVDTHVFGLRKKLGSYADAIETIRGVGYRVICPPPAH